jgi:hypothetical protein
METTIINTQLQKLVQEAHLYEEDAQEIIRIFPFLTEKRQLEILDDWPRISNQIRLHREQIEKEKEIFLIQTISDLERDLDNYTKSLVQISTKKEL